MTSAVRDEMVRAVMPELRLLMQHLVEGAVEHAVERAITPLLEKQRELEATLKELRSAQARSQSSSSARHVPDVITSAPSIHAEARPVTHARAPVAPEGAVAPQRSVDSAAAVPSRAAITARDVNLDDMPSELNGSRRKKVIVWAFAVGALGLLLSVIGMSVASNMGTYF